MPSTIRSIISSVYLENAMKDDVEIQITSLASAACRSNPLAGIRSADHEDVVRAVQRIIDAIERFDDVDPGFVQQIMDNEVVNTLIEEIMERERKTIDGKRRGRRHTRFALD